MCTTTKQPGRRPQPKRGTDYAVAGEAIVVSTFSTSPDDGSQQVVHRVQLLGAGRGHADRDEAVASFERVAPILRETDPQARIEVSPVYTSMLELKADYPDVKADITARSMLAREADSADLAEREAVWLSQLEAIGHEPCDRCGGLGGYKGWPGWTCYECNGAGHTEKDGGQS